MSSLRHILLMIALLAPGLVLSAPPREVVLTPSSNAVTPICDTTDVAVVNTIVAPLTIKNPIWYTTKPAPSQAFTLRLFSTTPQALVWGNQYSAGAGLALPTKTSGKAGVYDYLRFVRNSVTSKWDLVASTVAPAP